MSEKMSKLEKIAAKISGAVISIEYLLCYNNFDGLHVSGMNAQDRFRYFPIQESYFGDMPEIFATILASSFIGEKIKEYGEKKNNRFLEVCGKYFPTFTVTAVGAYYTLGETIMPQLLPGTADIKDVPAILITAIASPFIGNYVAKSWKNGLKEKVKKLFTRYVSQVPP